MKQSHVRLRCCFDCKSTKNLRAIHNEDHFNCCCSFVVSTAKVQKIWEQFTTTLAAYLGATSCFDCKSTKNLRAIHNCTTFMNITTKLFRLQKYKKFESNSQQYSPAGARVVSCFDCKSTKNLRAIHNRGLWYYGYWSVVSTAKVQKIWEQFTTSDEQFKSIFRCFDCKSTKNLRAIHNSITLQRTSVTLFRLQKYKKFESNSQLVLSLTSIALCCFDCKSTKNLRAIHNC